MNKYVKVDLSFGDKLKLLFFGIIPENVLITENIEKKTYMSSKDIERVEFEEDEDIKIPFFSEEDTKSNL